MELQKWKQIVFDEIESANKQTERFPKIEINHYQKDGLGFFHIYRKGENPEKWFLYTYSLLTPEDAEFKYLYNFIIKQDVIDKIQGLAKQC